MLTCEQNFGLGRVTVRRADGETARHPIEVRKVAPALFSANGDGRGAAAGVWVTVRPDGGQDAQPTFTPDQPPGLRTAVAPQLSGPGGELYLVLFGTGIRGAERAVNVTIGGAEVPVPWFGPQGGFVGLDQVNVGPIAPPADSGEAELVLTADGAAANAVSVQF